MTDQPQGTEPGAPDSRPRPEERAKVARPGGSGASLFSRRGALSPNEALQPEAAPPPPDKNKKRKPSRLGAVSGFLSFLLAAAVLLGVGVVVADRATRAPGPLEADKVVYIQQGSDSDQIIEELQTQGVIDQPFLFRAALMAEGARSKLKAGEYLFKQHASLQEVIDTIVSGKAILHSLTIPEGLTSQQVVDKLRQDDLLAGDIREVPREGSLLPETYKFQRGDSRDKLLQKMARDQKQLLAEIWRRRAPDLPLASPYELVTLASIVEKETGKADERPRVAAVFLNRLHKGMRLQSDPTIVYGLVGGQGPLGRPLTRADIESQTAYNTYIIDGLPPGPIANPGRAAMEAVANPSHTMDLYFVADGTGGHVFSETLDTHNRNVQRWRQIEQNAKPKAPGAPNAPAGRDNRTENVGPSEFGLAPTAPEFAARREAAPPKPRLRPDPTLIARVAPLLPDAPIAPLRVTDYRPEQGGAGRPHIVALGDMQLRGITRAENDLDGPAEDPSVAPAAAAPQGRPGAQAADLDGPATPVETTAMGYAGGIVNAAPNGKPRIFDAVAGTALDPLLDKSWDLNSPKNLDPADAKTADDTPKKDASKKKASR
ncbi:MAG TPA: endolytic transglycosylase MltG [Rhodoblastus sp.]|nr:endolytic transglycosylase MltG [Rhodoblastus sp.]